MLCSGGFSRARCPPAHHRVACHDGVVAIVIQRGCSSVQGAGSIRVTADPVMLASLGDLLAIFKPVNLQHKIRKKRQKPSDKLRF